MESPSTALCLHIDFYIDPVHFLELLTITDTEYVTLKQAVIDAYDQAVIACDHLEDDPVCGLSLHIPRRKVDYDRSFRFDELLSSYEELEFTKQTEWDEFLKIFLDI